jgi:hypothetical protein
MERILKIKLVSQKSMFGMNFIFIFIVYFCGWSYWRGAWTQEVFGNQCAPAAPHWRHLCPDKRHSTCVAPVFRSWFSLTSAITVSKILCFTMTDSHLWYISTNRIWTWHHVQTRTIFWQTVLKSGALEVFFLPFLKCPTRI